jgi:hypothetical protein
MRFLLVLLCQFSDYTIFQFKLIGRLAIWIAVSQIALNQRRKTKMWFMYNQLVVLALLTLILGFTVTGYAQEGAKPPLSSKRITGEFLAGVAVGTAAAVIPAYLLFKLFPREPGSGPAGAPANLPELIAFLSIPVGYAIGSAIGVYLVGNSGNQTGSFLLPLVGTSLVVIGGLAATFLSGHWEFIPVTLVGAPAVAVGVFNSTRRYKTDAGNSGSGNTTVVLGQMRF